MDFLPRHHNIIRWRMGKALITLVQNKCQHIGSLILKKPNDPRNIIDFIGFYNIGPISNRLQQSFATCRHT